MKIGIMLVGAFREPGGEEQVIYSLYKSLDRKKFKVCLAAPESADFFKYNAVNKDEFINIEMRSKFDLKSILNLRRIIKAYGIQIVHSHGNRGGFIGRLAVTGLKNVKSVWTMHIVNKENKAAGTFHNYLFSLAETVLGKYCSDRIITVSKDLKSKLGRQISPDKVVIIENGIDTIKFSQEGDVAEEIFSCKAKLKLGFISRLSIQKGIPYLMEAISNLKAKKLDIKLFVAGTGDMLPQLQKMIIEKDLKDYVTYLGFRTDIPKILRSIDVMILPSLFEGFPMIILESMSTGTPAIATAVNGVPEVVNHDINGYLIRPESVTDIENAIMRYYNNIPAVKVHGENSVKKIRKSFTREIMVRRHENLYKELFRESYKTK